MFALETVIVPFTVERSENKPRPLRLLMLDTPNRGRDCIELPTYLTMDRCVLYYILYNIIIKKYLSY